MSSGTGNGAIMRSEIAESVQVASRLIANRAHYEAIGAQLAERRPSVVVVAGRGTSDHAAIYARYLLEHALGVPVALVHKVAHLVALALGLAIPLARRLAIGLRIDYRDDKRLKHDGSRTARAAWDGRSARGSRGPPLVKLRMIARCC